MERLTYDFCVGDSHCWQVKDADNLMCSEVCRGQDGCSDCPIGKAFDRLAAYEDTGLTPDEIKSLIPPPNDPLTLEELRCMYGEPVWVENLRNNESGWAITCVSTCSGVFDTFLFINYGKNWNAYRRKPE